MTLTITPDMPCARDERFLRWLREQDIDPRDTYRLDVADGSVTVYRWVRIGDGAVAIDKATHQPMRRAPWTIDVDIPEALRDVLEAPWS